MKRLVVIATVFALVLAFAGPAFAWASAEGMLDHKTSILAQRVEEGVITQEQAETILLAVNERMENCSGSRDEARERLGQTLARGLGFGRTHGKGSGPMASGGNR